MYFSRREMEGKLLIFFAFLFRIICSVGFVSKIVLFIKVKKFFQKNHCIHYLFMLMYFLLYGPS